MMLVTTNMCVVCWYRVQIPRISQPVFFRIIQDCTNYAVVESTTQEIQTTKWSLKKHQFLMCGYLNPEFVWCDTNGSVKIAFSGDTSRMDPGIEYMALIGDTGAIKCYPNRYETVS